MVSVLGDGEKVSVWLIVSLPIKANYMSNERQQGVSSAVSLKEQGSYPRGQVKERTTMSNNFIHSDSGSWHWHIIIDVNVAKHRRIVSIKDERDNGSDNDSGE